MADCDVGDAVASGKAVGDTDAAVWVGLLRIRKNASLARMCTPGDKDAGEGGAVIDGTMVWVSNAPVCSDLWAFIREANSAARFRIEMLAAASLIRCDLAKASAAAAILSASAAAS